MTITLGTTDLARRRTLLERVQPLVGVFETTPDNLGRVRNGRVELHDEAIEVLTWLAESARIVGHGVGLSIGSHDGMNDDYLRLLDALFERIPFAWHSEHLAYTRVDGRDLGTMLTLPRTEAVVEIVAKRVAALRARYGVPFLLENVVGMLPESPRHDYTHAGFLNEIVRRSGCGLILDVYNLECDAHNQRLDLDAFFGELDWPAVRELHIANGVEHRGLLLDVHSRRTRSETRTLATDAIRRATNAEVIIFELLDEAVPALGDDEIVSELELLHGTLIASLPQAADVRELRDQQRGLAKLLRGGMPTAHPYLMTVASSERLEVVRDIIREWRELTLRRILPLTVELLERRGTFDETLTDALRRGAQAYADDFAVSFLEQLETDGDPLLDAVAKFETAMIATRRGDARQHVVRWPFEPHEVIGRLLRGLPLEGIIGGDYATVIEAGSFDLTPSAAASPA